MHPTVFRPLHCGISVTSIAPAIEWFEKNLNFHLLHQSPFMPMGFHAAFLTNGENFEIELFEPLHPRPLPSERRLPNDDVQTCGTKHIAFRVEHLDEVIAVLRENGVEIVLGPTLTEGMYMAFIHGPDDVLIELVQR